MLHLILVGGNLACASHGVAGHDAMPGMEGTRPSHQGAEQGNVDRGAARHADRGTAQPPSDCATSTQSHCCDAMWSCGVTTTVSARVQFLVPTISAAATPSYVASASLSVSATPDPPPPKA
jgi:hypothetical protein